MVEIRKTSWPFATDSTTSQQQSRPTTSMATASGSTCQEGERGECDDGGGDDNRDSAQETTSGNASQKKPVCLIVLGMAGSGKTTFVQVS